MKQIIPALALLLLQAIVKAENIFYWKWDLIEGQIKITGKLDHGMETVVYSDSHLTKQRFATLYRVIDEIEYTRADTYKKTVDSLSNLLVNPFSSSILKSQLIVIEINPALLNFPIEFLKLRDFEIALVRPLLFTLPGNKSDHYIDGVVLHRGFIIRDPSSDPENACSNIFRQYPGSEFKNADKIFEKDLVLKPGIDFILISAHGEADDSSFKGGIALNRIENVNPAFFTENNPSITYIDGCQQGINLSYISALLLTKETNFYLGPIISNDSGESSTKTINWFFAFLEQTKNPVSSIWKTRKKLYTRYSGKINQLDVVNKSLIFRIYML